jgi:subtilisin family serine protease
MTSTARAVALIALLVGACRDASTPFQPGPRQARDLALPLANEHIVPGQYIVVFREAAADPVALARTLVNLYGGSLRHTYSKALKGFAAGLSDAAVTALRQNPLIAYVERDHVVHTAGTQQMDANGDPWGLDRIDQRALPLSGTYAYTSTAAGVHAYLIDTGIWTLHPEFEGRADNVYDVNSVLGLPPGVDCNGHGTMVAGVVGSVTYGVAKRVLLHGVRVFSNCSAGAALSDVIAGVDWVTAHHASPAVANISISGDTSSALRTAVTNLWNSGVFVVATAANHNADACLEAGGASGAFTVAASTRTDAKADFSNWGSCVKVYAPGVDIKSTWLGGATMTLSGTSFAAPHVTGVAALYKATFGDAPSNTVSNWIVNNATAGVISGNPIGTPNQLVYKSTL